MRHTGISIGHTLVSGVMTHGGTCNRICLYENRVPKVKIYLDIGRESAFRPDIGFVHQTADIVDDLSKSDGLILSHAHDDHIAGLPVIVDLMRRQGKIVPPIYLEKLTHEILKHEFAFHGVGMEGLRILPIKCDKPFMIGDRSGLRLKVTPIAASHTIPTLSFIFQSHTKDPITMVWESDIKNDPSVMLRPGKSIPEILQMAGNGLIHNLATSVHRFYESSRNSNDGEMARELCQVAKAYQHVVFVNYGGSPDHSVLAAHVAAQSGKQALIYTGATHDMYLSALQQVGYDLPRAASANTDFRILCASGAEARQTAPHRRFVLADTGYNDVRDIMAGAPQSPFVPLGPETLFVFFDRGRDKVLREEIMATNSAVYQIPRISAHAHGIDVIERIDAYSPLSVTPLHAQGKAQKQFLETMHSHGIMSSLAEPGEEYFINRHGRWPRPIHHLFGRIGIRGSCLMTNNKPRVPVQADFISSPGLNPYPGFALQPG